mmetsp:Transcript_25886/g.59753  ORF Transcript_25886/g.59753 Transcript_25886/m.59753 type:complete len:210 (-) Transcript_25886:667-1296(-)
MVLCSSAIWTFNCDSMDRACAISRSANASASWDCSSRCLDDPICEFRALVSCCNRASKFVTSARACTNSFFITTSLRRSSAISAMASSFNFKALLRFWFSSCKARQYVSSSSSFSMVATTVLMRVSKLCGIATVCSTCTGTGTGTGTVCTAGTATAFGGGGVATTAVETGGSTTGLGFCMDVAGNKGIDGTATAAGTAIQGGGAGAALV